MIHLSKYLYLAAIIVIVVFSACSGNSNDEPENGGGNETGTLVLRTSATVIEANGRGCLYCNEGQLRCNGQSCYL